MSVGRIYSRVVFCHLVVLALLFSPLRLSATYRRQDLVGDQPGVARFTDPNLVNPWGLAASASGPWWVANAETGTSTLYNGEGQPFPLAMPLRVTIPAAPGGSSPANPTGLVFNGSGGFVVAEGGNSASSVFIFATENGTISGWNPNVNPTAAILAVDNSASGAIYKGLALASRNGASFLYAADFHNRRIDVFDSTFAPATLPGSFADAAIPAAFAPFAIHRIGSALYVTYARQDAAAADDVAGAGNGFVNVFDTAGNLVRRFATQAELNSPWGIALASDRFGELSNRLLIGNFGDGRIHAYDRQSGELVGVVRDEHDQPLAIEGLWALQFGNGVNAGPTNRLYFTAGPDGEEHGLFGFLEVTPKIDPGFVTPVSSSATFAADGASGGPAVNASGTSVAFYSDASNLVPGDDNGVRDVFVWDAGAGIELISVNNSGVPGNLPSHAGGFAPAINGDGRVVAFYSLATNLVEGDTNGVSDIFIRDRNAAFTERISTAADGTEANGASFYPSLSADARFVAFQSSASNLVADDTNGTSDIFIVDRNAGTIERACGVQGNDYSITPSISPDGNFVAFASRASNLVAGDSNDRIDVFVCDRSTGTLTRASVSSDGTQANGDSILPDISSGGAVVVFKSTASNLVANDRNGVVDVFARDVAAGTTERISVSLGGGDAGDVSFPPTISDDGRFVAFASFATNLVGRDHNGASDVFVRDRLIGRTLLADLNSEGEQSNRGTVDVPPAISGDGSAIAFVSLSSNLGAAENQAPDIFLARNPFFPPPPPPPSPTPSATITPFSVGTFTPTGPIAVTPTASSTPTGTETALAELTATATTTETQTAAQTATETASATPELSATETPSPSQTETLTVETTATPTVTPTEEATTTATAEGTGTPSATPTLTETETPPGSDTETPTSTPTESPTVTEQTTATPTETETPPDTDTETPTTTPTESATATEATTATPTESATATESTTATPTESATATEATTETPTQTATVTESPTLTPTSEVTVTATPTDTETATPSPTIGDTETPVATETATETPTQTVTETATSTPTETPTNQPLIACAGARRESQRVGIEDLVAGVAISRDGMPLDAAPSFDMNKDERVSVVELVEAVRNALNGCAP